MGAYDFLINGAQPVQLPDPMVQAQRAMSLAQIANQNNLAQYTLEAARRKDLAAQGVGQALGGLDINNDAQVTAAINAAPPEARQGILDAVLTARKTAATSAKDQAEAAKNQAQTKQIQTTVAGGLAQTLLSKGPNVTMQDVQAANANAARVGLPADMFTPPQGADPAAHWQSIAGAATSAQEQLSLAGQAAQRAETNRHNTTTEAQTQRYQTGELGIQQQNANANALRAKAAIVTADPFGLSGLNTGSVGGGAPAAPSMPAGPAPAGPALPPGIAPQDAQLFQAALADAAKNGQPTFKIGAQGPFNVADYQGQPQAPSAAPAAPGGVAGAMQSGKTGDEFLATLPPQVAGMVKAMIEGRQSPPAGAALRSPQVQQLIMLANQADPSFDATSWGARAAMAKDWGDQGAIGKSNLAINTVIGHLGDLKKSADALNNTQFPMLNSVVNSLESNVLGDPRYKAFDANAGAVAKELERAYRGTGGSQGDIDQMKNELSSAGSPAQMTAVIQKYVDLLQSKIEANADAYRKTMGREPPPLLSGKAQATRDQLAAGNAPAQPQSFDNPPDPAQFKGRKMQAPDGTTYQSDGTRWVPVR